jgi:hypothetical protein
MSVAGAALRVNKQRSLFILRCVGYSVEFIDNHSMRRRIADADELATDVTAGG